MSETGGQSSAAPAGGHDDCVLSLALLASFARPGTGGAPRAFVRGENISTGAAVEDDEAPAVDSEHEPEDDEDSDPNVRGSAPPDAEDYQRRASPPSRFNLGFRSGSFNLGRRRG